MSTPDKPKRTLKETRIIDKSKKLHKKEARAGIKPETPNWNHIHTEALRARKTIDGYGGVLSEANLFLSNLPKLVNVSVSTSAKLHNLDVAIQTANVRYGQLDERCMAAGVNALDRQGDVSPESMAEYHLEYVKWKDFQQEVFSELQPTIITVTRLMIEVEAVMQNHLKSQERG